METYKIFKSHENNFNGTELPLIFKRGSNFLIKNASNNNYIILLQKLLQITRKFLS